MTTTDTVPAPYPERPSGRSFLLDLLKAGGCILIVLHHLAFYGPMSDVVAEHWPALMDWLVDDGRLAVQVFLVCAGYLAAASFSRNPEMDARRFVQLAWRRYLRLSLPLLGALSMAVLVTELIRPHFPHPSLSAVPEGWQVVAHVLLLQHLIDLEALSAGVWYVAIDFQLYLLSMLALWCVSRWMRTHPSWRAEALRVQVFLVLTLLSLVRWNLNSDMDMYGTYFFGAYGMGWLAWRTRQSRIPPKGWVGLLCMGLLALWVDPRLRIMTAWAAAMLLAAAPASWLAPRQAKGFLQRVTARLALISYSVFVIHYAMSLVVSAVVTHWWPQSLAGNALGMLMALGLSLLAGAVLHRWTEQTPPTGPRWLLGVMVFIASATLAMHWSRLAIF